MFETLDAGAPQTFLDVINDNGQILGTYQLTVPVPEPSTWAMMLAGFAGFGFIGWRAQRKNVAATA